VREVGIEEIGEPEDGAFELGVGKICLIQLGFKKAERVKVP